MTYNIFLILIIVVAILLVLIIMVQNPKGGGLSSSFGGGGGGSQSLGGVQSTTNFLDKSTWTLSIVLLALILLSNISAPRTDSGLDDTLIQETLDNRDAQGFSTEEDIPTTLTDSIN